MKSYKSFISFEGIDFCGKSTQITMLVDRLKKINFQVKVIREPGGPAISEKIRKILLDPANDLMHQNTELFLYSAARTQMVNQSIIPELDKGVHIIADRYYDSTTAYQGYGRGIDLKFIERLNHFATSGLNPYLTFFIDIPPHEAEKRRKINIKDGDRLEKEGEKFYSKIRQGFMKLIEREPERIMLIDGLKTKEEIFEKIWERLIKIWDLHKLK